MKYLKPTKEARVEYPLLSRAIESLVENLDQNLTNGQIAAEAGVALETFRATRNGEKGASDQVLTKIAKALEGDPATLITACQKDRVNRQMAKLPASAALDLATVGDGSLPKELAGWPELTTEQQDNILMQIRAFLAVNKSGRKPAKSVK